ncbi:MAG: hypothetical protein Kow00114_04590 [Kiloniellaceae bacterium]
MGIVFFVFAICAVIPGLVCLALYYGLDVHCRFCSLSYFWFGECLGLWMLWVAAQPGTDQSYLTGAGILLATNAALTLYLVIQHRRRREALTRAPDSGGDAR